MSICPAALDKRATNRSNSQVVRRPFIATESDELERDQVDAVCR